MVAALISNRNSNVITTIINAHKLDVRFKSIDSRDIVGHGKADLQPLMWSSPDGADVVLESEHPGPCCAEEDNISLHHTRFIQGNIDSDFG